MRLKTPAEVAKAGYEALMADKNKVAPGLSAKLQATSGYLLPDAVNAQNIRNLMKDRNDVAQDKRMTITMALAVGAALLGGWWLLSRNRTNGVIDAYEKAKVRTKAVFCRLRNVVTHSGSTDRPGVGDGFSTSTSSSSSKRASALSFLAAILEILLTSHKEVLDSVVDLYKLAEAGRSSGAAFAAR
ncbi:hypothetical protein GCM10028818_10920 [Spirosoma horti]